MATAPQPPPTANAPDGCLVAAWLGIGAAAALGLLAHYRDELTAFATTAPVAAGGIALALLAAIAFAARRWRARYPRSARPRPFALARCDAWVALCAIAAFVCVGLLLVENDQSQLGPRQKPMPWHAVFQVEERPWVGGIGLAMLVPMVLLLRAHRRRARAIDAAWAADLQRAHADFHAGVPMPFVVGQLVDWRTEILAGRGFAIDVELEECGLGLVIAAEHGTVHCALADVQAATPSA